MDYEAEPLDQRLQIVIGKKLLQRIEEWRRGQPKIPSRSESVRHLIIRAIALDDAAAAAPAAPAPPSRPSPAPAAAPAPRRTSGKRGKA